MIKTFACKETDKLFNRITTSKIPTTIQRTARRKLEILDAAGVLHDLGIPPSNCLKKLSGNRQGQYSIRINDRYRICFIWESGDVYNVEIVDYH
ncbi:MAG: type II toxin-antitoxin system RelE/ParE family toxin [Candidatus Latescibacteria bacterium]|nr:type II toxin-antitoxin system RelE/ParE family toxin [Candidatus Latescibacterota bacterium]